MGKTFDSLSVSSAAKSILFNAILCCRQEIVAERPAFLVDATATPESYNAIVARHWEAARRLIEHHSQADANALSVHTFSKLLIEDTRQFADLFEHHT